VVGRLRFRKLRPKNRGSIRSRSKRYFVKTSELARERTLSLTRRVVRIISLGIKWPRRESDHSHLLPMLRMRGALSPFITGFHDAHTAIVTEPLIASVSIGSISVCNLYITS